MYTSTMTLLEAARAGGYALGAFNVYNLEGVRAVVAAAEAKNSPAMLQIHPSALKHGGPPLVALCLAAAREATRCWRRRSLDLKPNAPSPGRNFVNWFLAPFAMSM